MHRHYTYIDLFSGAGGLSIGFGRESFELLMANDIDNQALQTLRHNLAILHPETKESHIIHGDITEVYSHLGVKKVKEKYLGHKTIVTGKSIEAKKKAPKTLDSELTTFLNSLKECDVIAGGPPCQGFSMIGRSKRGSLNERAKGFIDDPRNNLFSYYLKFVEKLRPKLVLIENVKGLASAAGYRELIEESLRKTGEGYNTASHILNASYYGVPQNRERIFFIGVRNDISSKLKITAEDIFIKLDRQERKNGFVLLKDSILDLPLIISNPSPNNYSIANEVSFKKRKCFGMEISDMDYNELIKGNMCSEYRTEINTYRDVLIPLEKLFNHKARYTNERDLFIFENLVPGKYLNDPQNAIALSKVEYGTKKVNGKTKINGFTDKYFKLNPYSLSKTIIAHLETDGNSYVHPGRTPRSITPREAARLQSFPDWYYFTGSLRNQFRQIGNAVPPLFAAAIARQFKNVLNKYYGG